MAHEDTPRPRPPTIITTMRDLAGAHATVVPTEGAGDFVTLTVGTIDVAVVMIDEPAAVRQVLTDALAQLDAILGGR